ncbi:MAG: YhbY family RNA-binding protein [Succinivibrionaceae bacterium]
MLTKSQIKYLKCCAQDKKPVVTVGNKGLTDEVLEELNSSIDHHELMKIRVNGLNRDNKDDVAAEICSKAGVDLVQILGSVITLFRQKANKKESNYILPKD